VRISRNFCDHEIFGAQWIRKVAKARSSRKASRLRVDFRFSGGFDFIDRCSGLERRVFTAKNAKNAKDIAFLTHRKCRVCSVIFTVGTRLGFAAQFSNAVPGK